MTREQMISTLRGMDFGSTIGSKGDEALRMAIAELEQQPKTGHWIEKNKIIDYVRESTVRVCSECGAMTLYQDKYCHKCGARMEGSEENSDADSD